MTKLNQLAVATVLVVLCSWAAHAQGGAVTSEDTPMDPGGLPSTGLPSIQSDDQGAAVYLESRVIQIGDRLFDEWDPAEVAGVFMGDGLAIVFTIDRPIEGLVTLVNVDYVNIDGAATVRCGGFAGMVERTSGTALGNVNCAHNNEQWVSPRFHLRQAGTYVLTVVTNGRPELGTDDFVFGPVVLIHQPAEAVITLPDMTSGAGPVGGPPTMEYLPQTGIGLDTLAVGQATTWADAWRIANTGREITFLRNNPGIGFVGVTIPVAESGGSLVILDKYGTQWCPPSGGGEWLTLASSYPAFTTTWNAPATGTLGDIPVFLGPWYVTFVENQGTRWIVFSGNKCRIHLSSRGQLWHEDLASGGTNSFGE